MEVNKKGILRFVFLVFLIVLTQIAFHSCNHKTSSKPSSIGGTSEILVVVEDSKWESGIETIIKQRFMDFQRGLPQAEPLFTVVNLPPKSFSKMFKSHRNLFMINISPEHKKSNVEVRKNLWGQPQVVITVKVKDVEAFREMFEKHSNKFMEYFNDAERRRIIKAYSRSKDYKLMDKVVKHSKINLVLPTGYFLAKKGSDFLWLRKEPKDFSQGIILSWFDYTDTIAFNQNRIIHYRDSLTKLHIPGPSDQSYMSVSPLIKSVFEKINFNGNFAVETRGLWKVEGDFMGGPFLSYTFVDTIHQRVITLDGYVYAPKYKKRNYLKQIESILYSCKLVK